MARSLAIISVTHCISFGDSVGSSPDPGALVLEVKGVDVVNPVEVDVDKVGGA